MNNRYKNQQMKMLWIILPLMLALLIPRPTLAQEDFPTGPPDGMRNPSAVYCNILGYTYRIENDWGGGQFGVCELPSGATCKAWDFLAGKCGREYSACAKRGLDTRTVSDGADPFLKEYAICVDAEGRRIQSVTQMTNLFEESGGSVCDESSALEPSTPQSEDTQVDDTLPSSFDWRDHDGSNWLTPIKDQGTCGSCWAFAAVGVTEAHHNIIFSNPNLDLDLAEQDLVSCSGAGSCSGGSASSALQYIRDSGVVDEACFSYTASDSNCNKCSSWQNRLTHIDEKESFIPDRQSIRQNIVSYGPIYASMGIGEDYGGYFTGSNIYRCSNDSQNDNSGSNHAIVIVGYNNAGSYWIVRNSWGSGWNDNGYFKVGYDECNIESTYAAYAYIAPPVTSHSFSGTMGDDGWFPSNVIVTLTANETVEWTKYRVDRGGWKTYSNPFTLSSDGIHTLEYYSRDTFGGEENVKSTTVKIDKTAPTNPTSADSGCSAQDGIWQYTCTDPDLTWSGADDNGGSGVQDYHVYWGTESDGTPNVWRSSAGYDPGTINVSNGVAVYYLRISTRDELGHESETETIFTLRYDGSQPTGNPVINGGVETVHSVTVPVEPNGQDTGSGLVIAYLSNDGENWQTHDYASTLQWSLPPQNRTLHTVQVELADGVGNRSRRYKCQVCLDLYPAHPSSTGYRLWGAGPTTAGGRLSSPNYRLDQTVGQSSDGELLNSSNYRLRGGFQGMWPATPGEEMFTVFHCGQSLYLPLVVRNR